MTPMKSFRWLRGFLKWKRHPIRVLDSGEIRDPVVRMGCPPFQRGFTLIEILVVIVILSVVSAITIKFLMDSLKIYTMTLNQKTLYDEGKLALEKMVRDIRDAKNVTTPASGGSGNTIIFQRTNPTALDAPNETLTFRLTGTTLEKVKTSPAGTSPLASHVSTFLVTRGGPGEDEITLWLSLTLPTGENVTLQTKVYPKNLPASTTYKNFRENWREEPSL